MNPALLGQSLGATTLSKRTPHCFCEKHSLEAVEIERDQIFVQGKQAQTGVVPKAERLANPSLMGPHGLRAHIQAMLRANRVRSCLTRWFQWVDATLSWSLLVGV